jgi:hypothetical protein
LDARQMPNTVPTASGYLIDSRSAASKVPSYKRSTRLVIPQNQPPLSLTVGAHFRVTRFY